MKICQFCCKREIPFCKYNYSRQNCCGEDECLEKRRKGYQATVRENEYHKRPEVRERANRQRRARRRTAAHPLLPRILKRCAAEVKRIIEPLADSVGASLLVLVNKAIAIIMGALELEV